MTANNLRDPLAFLGEELDESSGHWRRGAPPWTSEITVRQPRSVAAR
jgi:hypothetical protein